jgi:putative MATE family efflux protein
VSKSTHIEGQDLTKGSIFKELWSLAWPMMLSVFFYTLYNIVDAFWVSKLSPEAIAAVSISQLTLFLMVALSMGITIGSGVLISMNIGAKNIKEAERVLGQSFVLSAIAALTFTIFSLVFRNELLTLSGATGRIFAPALEYFTITSGGSVLFFILFTIMFAFNSQGDTFTLTKLFAVSTLVNVIFDPLFIFGWFGFPALGISGAAYATLLSQAVFIVIAIHSLSSPHRKIRFHFYNLTLNWKSVKDVMVIGVPASLTQVISPIGAAALTYITSLGFKEPGAVAYSIGTRIEFFGFLPAVGFGFAALAMIGQSIGAGSISRARQVYKYALFYSFIAATTLGIIAALAARLLTGIFTNDPVVTAYSVSYIWIVALSYGFLAATMVEANTFQAIGKSWPGFWIFFLKFIVVSLPLSYILTFIYSFPVWGIWLAIVAGNVIAALVGYSWVSGKMRELKLGDIPVHH